MNPVEDYIWQKKSPIKEIMSHVHSLSIGFRDVSCALKWSLPMYIIDKKHRWYMNPLKTGGIELVFIQSQKFAPEFKVLLQQKSRKLMMGITIKSIDDPSLEEVPALLDHAIKISTGVL